MTLKAINWNCLNAMYLHFLKSCQRTVSHRSISIKSDYENRSRVHGRNCAPSHGAILMRSFQPGFCQIDSRSIANGRPDAIKSHHPRRRRAFGI